VNILYTFSEICKFSHESTSESRLSDFWPPTVKKLFLRTLKMHTIKDILRTISRQMQLSPNLLTVSSPMGANTASHKEQHYLWASVSEGKLWWFSSMISLPKKFLCTCYPERTSKHALSHYQLPFFYFPTSYVTVHS